MKSDALDTAISTNETCPSPAPPSTGLDPPAASRTTDSERATNPLDPGGRPPGSTPGHESRGCGAATPGTLNGCPSAVMLTSDTPGTCRRVHTSCCDSACRALSPASRTSGVRSTTATPDTTGTDSIPSPTPFGNPVRTAGRSHSLGPATRYLTSVVACPGPSTGIIRGSGTRVLNVGSKKYTESERNDRSTSARERIRPGGALSIRHSP
ncbi:unannotated protein [freshwater metagenome]|uniref:Unannotated protein n=1 Tax=freshwater metagenome TaxID=449393 RepID=A0A6J7QY62_9ZZZZ